MAEQFNKKILLAVDGSDCAMDAVRYVSRIPPFQRMHVVLFNVFSKIPECYWDLASQPQYGRRLGEIRAWEMQKEKSIQEYMGKALQTLLDAGFPEDTVTVKIHERETGIARDIVKEAQRGYSAVAVGKKGKSKLKDLILGSTACKLLERLAFLPLMMIGRNPLPGKILLALDGSEGAMRALDYVGATLGGFDQDVTLLHVIRGELEAYAEEPEKRMSAVFDEAKSRLMKSGFSSDHVTARIITGAHSRAGAIVQEAKRGSYGTIVVGRRGLSRVQDFFMGRVSNKVVQLAKERAVWVVSGKGI